MILKELAEMRPPLSTTMVVGAVCSEPFHPSRTPPAQTLYPAILQAPAHLTHQPVPSSPPARWTEVPQPVLIETGTRARAGGVIRGVAAASSDVGTTTPAVVYVLGARACGRHRCAWPTHSSGG